MREGCWVASLSIATKEGESCGALRFRPILVQTEESIVSSEEDEEAGGGGGLRRKSIECLWLVGTGLKALCWLAADTKAARGVLAAIEAQGYVKQRGVVGSDPWPFLCVD